MKKYAYIILTTVITLSTTCMEKESRNIQEKKPLIRTNNSSQADQNHLIDPLYNAARNFDINNYFTTISISTHRSLINLITLMNNALQHEISEDYMGEFAYKKCLEYKYAPTPLYFHFLQKYNSTKEKLPFTADELYDEFCEDNKLAEILNQTYTYQSIQDIQNKLTAYPAYTHLIDQFRATKGNVYNNPHYTLCICLYAGTKTLCNNYPKYSDVTDFNGFYSRACKILYYSYHSIYNFINLIARLKNIEKISDEKHFISKILKHNPTKTYLGFTVSTEDDISTYTKHKMALFYTLIERYNRARGNKETPTGYQFEAFLSLKNLDINLPNNFDKTVFDENKYAFTEFDQLSKNITTVINASHLARAQSIKKILQ